MNRKIQSIQMNSIIAIAMEFHMVKCWPVIILFAKKNGFTLNALELRNNQRVNGIARIARRKARVKSHSVLY